jgi:exodeoxyribonuclease VIII
MPDEKYFADPAVSNSDLKKVARSPAHFKEYKQNPPEPTKAMAAGSAGHCAILEPEEFSNRYSILPDNAPAKPTDAMLKAFEKGSKQQQSSLDRIQFWSTFQRQSEGKLIISNEDAAKYLHIGGLIRNHPELSVFFESGLAERAIFAKDPVTGILCKCKPDYLTKVRDYKVMIEVKSTEDARPDAFTRTAYNFGYFQAAAWYTSLMDWAGLGAPDLYLIVVYERDPPHGIKIYEVPPEAMEFGERRYRQALDLYAYCKDMGEWPNYDTTVESLRLPNWAKD